MVAAPGFWKSFVLLLSCCVESGQATAAYCDTFKLIVKKGTELSREQDRLVVNNHNL